GSEPHRLHALWPCTHKIAIVANPWLMSASPLKADMREPLSPDGEGDRPCQRRDHKAEVDPAPISLNGPGKHKKMEHDPQTHRDSQHEPNQIAGGLVDGPNGFALGAAKAYSYGHERPEKQRTKNDRQYSQSHRDGRSLRPGVSWTAHGLKLAYSSFFSGWICCCCCIGGCGCAGCGGSICCSLNSRWAISKLLGRWLAMSFSFCAMMSRAARVCGSVVDRASAKHCAAVLLSSSVRFAIGYASYRHQPRAAVAH